MPTLLPNGATVADPGDQPGALITTARQIEYAGLLLGAGTPYRWKELTGWDDLPGLDLSDSPRPNDHGDFPGMGLYQARLPALTLAVHGDSVDQVESLLQLLEARTVYTDQDQQLIVRDGGRTLAADARVIARSIPHQPNRTIGIATASVQWRCANPLRRASTGRTVHLVVTEGSGGLTYPLTYPLDYGTEGGAGAALLVNDGSAPAPARITFHGPGTGHTLVLASGPVLRVNTPLADGDTLSVDTLTGTVLLNGTASRSGDVDLTSGPPEAWRIPPGATSCSYQVATGAGPATAADIDWFDSSW